MKVKIELELEDVLQLAVLLDHHRVESAEKADTAESAPGKLYTSWGYEAAELRKRLLRAVQRGKP